MKLFNLVFVFCCCLFAAACAANDAVSTAQIPVAPAQMPPTSKPMPPINADTLNWKLVNGRTERVSTHKGKVVILDFWATYCPPCEEGIPHFVELSKQYKNDLHVVGLHVGGEPDKPKIIDFVTKYQMTYDLGYPNQALADFYLQGDTRIPQTLVFDRQGQLVQKFVGFTPEIKLEIDGAVKTAMEN